MEKKVCEIVLSGLRGIFEQHKDLMAKKDRADRVEFAAMRTPSVSAVIPIGTGLRDQEMQFLGMASALFFIVQSLEESGLLANAKGRKRIADELRKLNSEFPANQIRNSLEKMANKLAE